MNRIIALIFSILFLGACSIQRPIYNVSDSPIPIKTDGSMLTMEEVNAAIISAAKYKRWRPENAGQNAVEASITVRGRHTATVNIDYSQRSYSITLVNSSGLDQKSGKIHRNYNKWITLLDEAIQKELTEKATE